MYICPVCGYDRLQYPARDFTICPCCGNEFGYDDTSRTFEELRHEWLVNGMGWHSRVIQRPLDWNPAAQLLSAGFLPVVNKPGTGASEQKSRYATGTMTVGVVGVY
jgi:hypothetical protein